MVRTDLQSREDGVRGSMTESAHEGERITSSGLQARLAERRTIVTAVVAGAIVLFVGTAASVLTRLARQHLFGETGSDYVLSYALAANVALILVGWRHHIALTRELSRQSEAEAEALRLARTDHLTGSLNRRSLETGLVRLIAKAEGSGDEVVLLLIDLDYFKRANDIHGHATGDQVLIETARRLRSLTPPGTVIARIGGDEFVLAAIAPRNETLPTDGLPVSVAGEALARAVNSAIAAPIPTVDDTVRVTASIGIAAAIVPPGTEPHLLARTLLHQADLAMYEAKHGGRDRACRFEPDLTVGREMRASLGNAIRSGLALHEFVPFYERLVDLRSGQLIGFEMSPRWRSRRFGLVGADVFLPLAEEIGRSGELFDAVFTQSLHDMAEWAPHLTLSLRVPASQLCDAGFGEHVLSHIASAAIDPRRISLEIAETCLSGEWGEVRSIVETVGRAGVQIAIGDFGTGYAGLARVRTLPLDRIKIDRAFVGSITSNPDSSTIVEAIGELGRGLELPVTADGIETIDVMQELVRLGALQGQGALFGQAMSGETLRHELAGLGLLGENPPQKGD